MTKVTSRTSPFSIRNLELSITSDKLFIAGNSYAGKNDTRFGVVRYGNVMGSRGSVIPFFINLADTGVLPITDKRMTRFMITLDQAVDLVWQAFEDMVGGEIYVKKTPSIKVTDIATAISSEAKQEIVGIRPGEKLHEQMISHEDAPYTYEYADFYKILPALHNWCKDLSRINDGKLVKKGFSYTSDNNHDWMTIETLRNWIIENKIKEEGA